jgi:hypothetical protein
MTQTIVVSPEYAQVVILDPTAKVEVPRWERGVPFVASSTCILFGCMVDCDGETEITFGRADEVACDLRLTFDGILSTPGRRSAVENVWTDPIFESPT